MTPTATLPEVPPSIAIQWPDDVISKRKAFIRALRPLRVFSDKSLRGPFTQRQFVDASVMAQRRAAASADIQFKTVALWRMERLGFAYCRHGQGTLNDNAIPVEAQPISHIGLGIAATESAEFAPEKILELIKPRAHPDFRPCSYESIGCMWAAYAFKWFRFVFRFVSRTRILPRQLPAWNEFIGHFPADLQRLISHGYGRTLYLRELQIGRAMHAAVRLDGLDTAAAVQGIAFAYAMINHEELYRVLEVGSDLKEREIERAFWRGLVGALAFWDWTFPGFLDHLTPASKRQQELIEEARKLTDASRQSGRLSVLGVD